MMMDGGTAAGPRPRVRLHIASLDATKRLFQPPGRLIPSARGRHRAGATSRVSRGAGETRLALPVGALGSIDLEAPQVVVQLTLLAALGVLQRLDLLAQVVELGLLLVELRDVPGVEVGVLRELAHVLADASLL